jgi:hypothetical protein
MRFRSADLLDGEKKDFIDSLKNAKPPLQKNSLPLFNSFGNAMLATKPNRDNLLNDLYRTSKKLAIEIIELIKAKYHLKD